MKNFFNHIDSLVELRHIFRGENFAKVSALAARDNPWFTTMMIDRAADAICGTMLSSVALSDWLSSYEKPSNFVPKRVGIIAAGNIPMVSFFDLLCAVVVGHNITFKPSSKDRLLMEYIIGHLSTLVDNDIDIVSSIDRYDIDFLIATGSDATADSVEKSFAGIPSIIRRARHSVARLSGNESREQLAALNEDIFLYYGLGCRNISHLIVPDDYDIEKLGTLLCPFPGAQFQQKVRYEKALLLTGGAKFIAANGFILQPQNPNATPPIGVVGYSRQNQTSNLELNKLQCTIGMDTFAGNVDFGMTQKPKLYDYPDHIDVIDFLLQ